MARRRLCRAAQPGGARGAGRAVLPTLVEALADAPDPDAAILKLDSLFERMTSAINIFRLLEARPGLASLTVAILSHAAPLAPSWRGVRRCSMG